MNLLIYAANIHVGGGVQVATSLIEELSKFDLKGVQLTVWLSSTIDHNLRSLDVNSSSFYSYKVINHYAYRAYFSPEKKKLKDFDGILVVFGPHYFGPLIAPNVVGFAQAWIIYDNNEVYSLLPLSSAVKLRIKYFLQGLLFKSANLLLVELEHVKEGLAKKGIMRKDRIKVSHNCISSIFFNNDKWEEIRLPNKQKKYRLGFVGRNYLHKNTSVFPNVSDLLRSAHAIDVEFLVTFTDEEWRNCSHHFRENVRNIGPLSIAQLPNFYQNLDGLIFPSLLECFSVTPLEAMVMKCPIFASDRLFIRDVCNNYVDYFDPLNPVNIASVVAERLKNPRADIELELARNYALKFSTPTTRAKEYLQYLIEVTYNHK